MTTHEGDSLRLLLVAEGEPNPLLLHVLGGFRADLVRVAPGPKIAERCVEMDPTAIVLCGTFAQVLDQSAAIRGMETMTGLPLVVLTTDWPGPARARLLEYGAYCCLEPPYPLGELRARLSSALTLGSHLAALERTSRIDALTGLWNRASFELQLAATLANAERSGQPFALALADLDHFKRLNDTFGHAAGDDVLRCFARTLQHCTREGDVACRYGGEEFAIIFPDTSLQDAVAVCQRIRRATEELDAPGVPAEQFTVSLGVATSDRTLGMGAETLVRAADLALYDAKRAGRNRVHYTSEGTGPIRMAG